MRRWIVAAAVLVGVLVLALESYYLYRFYAESDVSHVGQAERRASGPETRPAENAEPATRHHPETKTRPEDEAKLGNEAEAEARTSPEDDTYLREVGKLQAEAVETFLDSLKRLRRYDSLTAEDVGRRRTDR